ncbi:ABC transporter ATP-binding protein [Clostridium sp. 'deep sea']|uniref:ABC transporter ATP-binding protein n=1 Tax=Clostridium sp. 'deep sea' TaxID=2779445 RepID=UPI0018964804|nr:ABC transporter ATP-binding protein [Clostridium sp. 'deep sea']QOR36159.1 ABC transporter ATP-binding protein [Clostridium sp. 'deep sea']
MIGIIKRLLRLADNFAARIKASLIFGFFEGIFINFTIFAMLLVLSRAINNDLTLRTVKISAVLVAIGLLGQYVFKRLIYKYQDETGYMIFERERLKIGDHLKRLPMGYFSEGNLGNLTAVVTSDITFVEMFAMNSIYKVANGFISIIIGSIFLFFLDYRIALISLTVYVLAMILLSYIQKIGKKQSFKKQKIQAKLSGAVLEYIQGISVIKAFNMTGGKSKDLLNSFKLTRDHSIEFEESFIPPNFLYDMCFYIGITLTVYFSSEFWLSGTLSLNVLLMLLVFIFEFYMPTKALGILTAKMRVMDAALDRYEAVKQVKIIDENSQNIELNNYEVEFSNVTFAYDSKDVLHDINFKIPQQSMTALVGPSGCGKTTIANLIARFWDVQCGEIKVGGVNVKEISCDSLLKNISMVFQKVYLFNDTILNNIKFGKPNASMQEVIDVCKKARCYDFIMQLEHGYDTMVGESGSNLSGGEKQRISIARAMLKDAPIILLDEATASVDPDNEKHIQMAINELVKDKTLIVIAHRLSTIKAADQIIVLNNGRIIEKGIHQELLQNKGQYYDFWLRRQQASSWKVKK